MKLRSLSVAVLLLLLGWAATAQAEPTLWQRAKDPGAELRARARLRAEQLFEQATDARGDPDLGRELAAGSAALLELSGARRDPWQAVLLGRVLLDGRPGREADAVRLIESGVFQLPDSDFKRASLFDAGLGSMLSGDMERAVRAFTGALSLAWDPDYRASIHRNRGKAQMLAGHLTESVRDFRAAVGLARGVEVMALSHFGLGVALERSGDYPQGMQEIARGVRVKLPVPPYPTDSVLDLPSLRWIPDYDVHYFRGLGEMTEASDPAADPDQQLEHWLLALESWEQYLPAATASRDRFVPNAERHRQRCREAVMRLIPKPSGRVR